MTPDGEVQAAIELLRANDYVVYRKEQCTRDGGHGRHTLKTRSQTCPGVEPLPHGVVGVHLGPLDYWVHCACGSSFHQDPDYKPSWDDHKAEHNIVERSPS